MQLILAGIWKAALAETVFLKNKKRNKNPWI